MASLLEVICVRVKEIAGQISIRQETLNGWDVRHARHLAPGEYEFFDSGYQTVDVGDIWARQGQTAFLEKKIAIPADWAGMRVALQLKTSGEGLLSINGKHHHGVDDNRGYILLTYSAIAGESFDCKIEITTAKAFDYLVVDECVVTDCRDESYPYILSEASLLAIDPAIEGAYYDFKVAWDAAAAQKDSVLQEAILLAMKDALYGVDFRYKTTQDFKSSLASARDTLRKNLDAIKFGDCSGQMFCVGHSHIDVAWLWPLKETARKVGRTYSTVTALMDEYPDYHFVCSQVPLFMYLKEHFPDVYERVKERVAEGRFEPVGGTWVENDCNVVSGESLVRQCLYGQRFFKKEFGVNVRVGWLPDVFGYSWAMPQIYKKSGIEYFLTAKLIANDTNHFPNNAFWWQGMDGTKILSQFVGTYSASLKPDQITNLWDTYNAKLTSPEFITTYGLGDGGGGPTREMLEYLPRLANMPGLPKAHTGRAHDFFDRLASDAENFPVWNGELYFELHRGTYTSRAKNKRNNRKSELLYREAEMWSSAAAIFNKQYPMAELAAGWQGILLNQFHDIIPGSSIEAVYEDSDRHYEEILANGKSLLSSAVECLVGQIDTRMNCMSVAVLDSLAWNRADAVALEIDGNSNLKVLDRAPAVFRENKNHAEGMPVVVFNSLSWDRTDAVTLPLGGQTDVIVLDPQGDEVPSQVSEDKVTFIAENVKSCGYGVYRIIDGDSISATPFMVDGNKISTPYYELVLASDGTIRQIFDKTNAREIIPEGARANVLQVFEDKPCIWDAWDIELQYQDKSWEFEAKRAPVIIENGPVRLVLGLTLAYGNSTVDQQIVFYAHTPRIDFINHVDWQESNILLKASFPVDIHSTRATYEIAFGAVERPTHWNTSWDKARFEVCGHRWADLSEAGYGVSVLNDCKYGWDIKDNVIRLTLLRSPESPCPESDRGEHEFTYSLYPHKGDWTSGTVRAGQELNCPMLVVTTDTHGGQFEAIGSFISVDNPNVIVDTVKQAEDSDDLIVRVYEAHGSRGSVAIRFNTAVLSAVECNLLEEEDAPVDFDESDIRFSIKPFEIRSFKIRLEQF